MDLKSGLPVLFSAPQVAQRTAGMKPTELRGVPQRILLAAGAAKPKDEHELAGILNWMEVGPIASFACNRDL